MHVRPTCLNTDLAHAGNRRIPHPLVFLVGECLGWRDGNRITRMNTHRVKILDRADDHDVVGDVPHHLHLVLFPPDHGFLEQDLVNRREFQATTDLGFKLVLVVCNPSTGSAQRVAGTNDHRQPDLPDRIPGLLDVVHDETEGNIQSDRLHGLLEARTLLGLGDHVLLGPDQLDAQLVQYPTTGEVHGHVEPGLPTQRWQQRVGAFHLDDLLDVLPGDRFDVSPIRHLGVGHDRGGVRVDQGHLVPFLAQRLARLGT